MRKLLDKILELEKESIETYLDSLEHEDHKIRTEKESLKEIEFQMVSERMSQLFSKKTIVQ